MYTMWNVIQSLIAPSVGLSINMTEGLGTCLRQDVNTKINKQTNNNNNKTNNQTKQNTCEGAIHHSFYTDKESLLVIKYVFTGTNR